MILYLPGRRGREKEKERNLHRLFLTRLQPGTRPQPRHVPWPGIELATFPFAGWWPTHTSWGWMKLLRPSTLWITPRTSQILTFSSLLPWMVYSNMCVLTGGSGQFPTIFFPAPYLLGSGCIGSMVSHVLFHLSVVSLAATRVACQSQAKMKSVSYCMEKNVTDFFANSVYLSYGHICHVR